MTRSKKAVTAVATTATRRSKVEDSTVDYKIREMDILCSKDKTLSNHPGNRLFRQLIAGARESYKDSNDRTGKIEITKRIMDCLRNDHGCRFVKFDADMMRWVELNPVEARDKVSHALRFAIREHTRDNMGRKISRASNRKAASTLNPKGIKLVGNCQIELPTNDMKISTSTLRKATSTLNPKGINLVGNIQTEISTNDVKIITSSLSSSSCHTESNQNMSTETRWPNKAAIHHDKTPKMATVRTHLSFSKNEGTRNRLSISMEKVQAARKKLDGIIQRHIHGLQIANMDVPTIPSSTYCLSFPTYGNNSNPAGPSLGFSEEYPQHLCRHSSSSSDSANHNIFTENKPSGSSLFTSQNLDFLIGDFEDT